MSRYRRLASYPGVLRVGIPSVLGRLPLGMTALALLLLTLHSSGSFGFAGLATGCFALATGLSSPVRGRLVDRRGARPVLVVTGVCEPLALVAVLGAVLGRAGAGAVLAAVAVAGAFVPPIGPVVRVLWQRIGDSDLRQAALSLDAVVLQVIYYSAGPPLVTLVVLLASPAAALGVVATLTLIGALAVASAPACRDWPLTERRDSMLGALAAPGVAGVLGVVLLAAAAIGALEVAVTAFAAAHHVTSWSGLLLALLGIGSIAGGVFQGAKRWHSPLVRQYRAWLAVLCVLLIPLLAAGDPAALGGLLIIAGLAIAPASSVQFNLIGAYAREGSVTETFTWLLSASLAGSALGAALGGALAQASGARVALAAPIVLAAAAFLLSLAGGRPPHRRRSAVKSKPASPSRDQTSSIAQ